MRTLKREGYCKQEDLVDILTDLLDAMHIVNITQSLDDINIKANVENLKISYNKGRYEVEFNYSLGEDSKLNNENDDEQEGPFREDT